MVQLGGLFDNIAIFFESPKKATKNILDIGYDKIENKFSLVLLSGLTLTNNGMKYIKKVNILKKMISS